MDYFCGFWRRDCDILSCRKKAEYLYTVSRDLGFVCVCANAMSCEKNAAPRERPTQPGYMVLSGRFPTGVVPCARELLYVVLNYKFIYRYQPLIQCHDPSSRALVCSNLFTVLFPTDINPCHVVRYAEPIGFQYRLWRQTLWPLIVSDDNFRTLFKVVRADDGHALAFVLHLHLSNPSIHSSNQVVSR